MMLFKHTALLTSIIALTSAAMIPDGYQSVTTLDSLSSLATTSNFLIIAQEDGTELRVNYAYSTTGLGEGSPVVAYAEQTDIDLNQQVSPWTSVDLQSTFFI